MMRLDFDPVFVEISYEMWALGEQLRVTESQLEFLREESEVQTSAKIREAGVEDDPIEAQSMWREHAEIHDRVLPRLLRGSFLVALFAAYEASIKKVAAQLQAWGEHRLELDDLRGDSLRAARRYFEEVLRVPLVADNVTWERLMMLSVLRNVYAHANGSSWFLSTRRIEEIRKWERFGVDLSDGDVQVTRVFLEETYGIVRADLEGVVARARQAPTRPRYQASTKPVTAD